MKIAITRLQRYLKRFKKARSWISKAVIAVRFFEDEAEDVLDEMMLVDSGAKKIDLIDEED